MLVFYGIRLLKPEYIVYIGTAPFFVQMGLCRVGYGAPDNVGTDWDAGDGGYAPRNPLTLVVTPFPFPFVGQRERDEHVYTLKERLGSEVLCPSFAKRISDLRAMPVLQLEQDLPVGGFMVVVEHGCAFLHRQMAQEGIGYGIVRIRRREDGKFALAYGTNISFR